MSINVSDLTRHENMTKQHKFSKGATVKYNNADLLTEQQETVRSRTLLNSKSLFVVGQDRDCDGTPLYTLCPINFWSIEEVEDYVINELIGFSVLNKLNKIEQSRLISKTLNLIVFRAISEDDLILA